jgi:hypothetical protein
MAVAINADILLVHVFQLPINYSEVPLSITEADMMANAENAIGRPANKPVTQNREQSND